MTNNFYNIQDTYTEKFYQLPQVFFTSPKYKKLSNDAKVAYTLLKDRNNYSIKNKWFDEEGNIYFIFTVNELMTLLRCGNQKVNKIKRELEEYNLLVQKRMGLNKPNRLYLLRPEITAEDAYIQANEEAEMQEHLGKAMEESSKSHETHDHSSLNTPESTKLSDKVETQANYFDIFTKGNLNLIKLIADNTDLEEVDIKNVMFTAKNKALKDEGLIPRILDLKDFQGFVQITLESIVRSLKSKDIQNVKGYLYISIYKGFVKFAQAYREWAEKASMEELSKNVTENDLREILKYLSVEQ